jgi:hypothetical protein
MRVRTSAPDQTLNKKLAIKISKQLKQIELKFMILKTDKFTQADSRCCRWVIGILVSIRKIPFSIFGPKANILTD